MSPLWCPAGEGAGREVLSGEGRRLPAAARTGTESGGRKDEAVSLDGGGRRRPGIGVFWGGRGDGGRCVLDLLGRTAARVVARCARRGGQHRPGRERQTYGRTRREQPDCVTEPGGPVEFSPGRLWAVGLPQVTDGLAGAVRRFLVRTRIAWGVPVGAGVARLPADRPFPSRGLPGSGIVNGALVVRQELQPDITPVGRSVLRVVRCSSSGRIRGGHGCLPPEGGRLVGARRFLVEDRPTTGGSPVPIHRRPVPGP